MSFIVHIGFPGQCNIVVCTVHTTFFNNVHTSILHWHGEINLIQGVPEKAGTNVCVHILKHTLYTFLWLWYLIATSFSK